MKASNILYAPLITTRDQAARSRFIFEMADPRRLDRLLTAVCNVDGVYDAQHVSPNSQ
jgi:hypothetical protein